MSAVANPSQALHKPTQAKSKYRPEIDGLRAFAVVAVIINHFNKDLLPSGYLGVDIFFVISGYVITSSLAGRESKNFLDFLTGFYERRVIRLVPALVVFVLITSVAICLFNPEPKVALTTGATSLFGLSNLYLFKQSTDYFAQSTQLNPFTHTWSLGVEEQFYLLFPFLIWFSGFGQQSPKGARNLFFWVGTLTIVSLISFIYLYQFEQPAAYFLMPPRFWEMAAGCLVFIGFQKRVKVERALEQVPPLIVVASMVGVMLRPTGNRIGTLAIVLLTAVLIACLKKGTATYKVFTAEGLVYIGLISYSLYLWHWTVLSISRWTIGIHWWSIPLQIGLMLLLSCTSYYCLERPIRTASVISPRKGILVTGVAFSCISALSVIALGQEFGKGKLYIGEKGGLTYEFDRLYSTSTVNSKCVTPYRECLAHKQSSRDRAYFLWIGDSHTTHYIPLAELLYQKNGANYALYQSSGPYGQPFPPLPFSRQGRTEDEISKEGNRLRNSLKGALDFANLSVVVISSYLPVYFQTDEFKFKNKQGDSLGQVEAFKFWLKEVERSAIALEKRNAKMIVILPTPVFRAFPGVDTCSKQPFRTQILDQCKQEKQASAHRAEIEKIRAGIYNIKKDHDNIFIFDPSVPLCGVTANESCKNFRNGDLIYIDSDHLKKEASNIIYPYFIQFLKANLLLQAQ